MTDFETHIIERENASDGTTRKVVLEEAIEAILFAAGHPITYATLARVFDLTPTKVKEYVMAYAECYNSSPTPRGVELLTFPDSCQLVTRQHYLSEIRDTLGLKKTGTISTSSMETLAIVAYNQPVTRVFVDTLRRADSSYAMNNLLDRGLIECKGRLDVPGRPMLYGTTSDFLRCFGLHDLSELPQTTEELNAMFQKAQNTTEDPSQVEGAEQINLFDSEVPDGETAAALTDTQSLTSDAVPEEYDEPSAEDDIHIDESSADDEVHIDESSAEDGIHTDEPSADGEVHIDDSEDALDRQEES